MNGFELSVIAAKTGITLVVLLVLYRLLGKRDLAQYNVYDLVTVMAVANALQNAITEGKGHLLVGIVASGTLILLGYFATHLFARAEASRRILVGIPVLLVHQGVVLKARMKQEHVTRDELDSVIRQHGLSGPQDVEMAVLEVDGSISVVPKGRHCDFSGIDCEEPAQ